MWRTAIPAPTKGGHKFMAKRSVRAETFRTIRKVYAILGLQLIR